MRHSGAPIPSTRHTSPPPPVRYPPAGGRRRAGASNIDRFSGSTRLVGQPGPIVCSRTLLGRAKGSRHMTRTRVVLVDDHELFRTGVRHVLMSTGEFEPVGEARTARAAFALIDATRADVVLMDVSLPGMDGVVATREVRRRAPETRVLIMSAHDQVRDVLEALSAGASGYIIKSEAPETLLSALRAVARGETYLASGLSARIAAH